MCCSVGLSLDALMMSLAWLCHPVGSVDALKSQSGEAWGVPFEPRWGALACWTLQGAARQTALALEAACLASALTKSLQM